MAYMVFIFQQTRDWHFIIVKDRETAARLLDIVPKGISDEDMNQLIKDWNLNDSLQKDIDIKDRIHWDVF